jgi:Dolichyl-phosphate-mannose-protein mannosyltransferase
VERLRAFARGPRLVTLLIAAAAGLHGLVYIPLVEANDETDSWSYLASANAIRDGSYSTPLKAGFYFVFPAGWFDITGARIEERAWQAPERQAFRPPGYPLYIALFGDRTVFAGDHLPVLVGQAVLFALGAWLLMLSVRRWWGEGVALLAGLLYAFDPWSKHYVAIVLSETLAGTLALAGIYTFTRAWESRRVSWWVATGALAASLSLVRAVFVFTVPLAVVGAALARGDAPSRLVRAGATAAASAILLVPWAAWTNDVVGRPAMSVWGEAYNLILAANGEGHRRTAADVEAEPAFQARLDRLRATVPATEELLRDPEAHPRYLERADATLRNEATELYGERLREEPFQVAWEGLYRMWFLWNAHGDWYQPGGAALLGLRLLDLATIVLALIGSALAVARGGAGRGVVVLLVIYTLILATHHVEARFAMPLRGVLLALVALTVATLWARRQAGQGKQAQPEGRGPRAADGGDERLSGADDDAGRDDAGARGAERPART